MRRVILAILALGLLGCEGRRDEPTTPEPAPTASESGDGVALGPDARTIYQRSLRRDPTPTCEALVEGIDEPVPALLEVTERAQQPPASGMRAATCLVRDHAEQIEPTLIRWVRERRTMGFGLLVLNQLPELEEGLRERLVEAALAGEYPDEARRRIERAGLDAEGDPGGDTAP